MVFAQESNSDPFSKQLDPIEQLKDGTLAIVLISENRKIKILEELIKDETKTKDFIERTRYSLQEIIQDRDKKNRNLISSFKAKYKFSDLKFIYDYSLRNILAKDTIEIISDELTTSDIIKPEKLFFAKYMRSDIENSTNVYAWKIHDSQLEMIMSPFPNSFSISSLKSAARSTFKNTDERYKADANDIAKSMNKGFNEYYQEVVLK